MPRASPASARPSCSSTNTRKGPGGAGGPGPSRSPRLRTVRPVALCGNHLVGRVVAVLLGVEPAPARLERLRRLRAEDAVRAGIAVGDDDPRDLVVVLVLAEAAVSGVERGRGVTALRQPANRLVARVRVVRVDVQDVARVEGVALLCSVAPASSTNAIWSREMNVDVVEPGVGRSPL